MKKQKKSLGCGGYLLSWGVVTVVLCVLFSVINKTGQSMTSIIFISVFIGFFLAFFVWGFYIFFKTKREMKNKNQGGNQQEVEINIPTPDMKTNVVRQEVPQQVSHDMRMTYTGQQASNDIRIIDESVAIMEKTSDIDTFLSRYETAMRSVLTLEQAKKAGVAIALPDGFSQSLVNAKGKALEGVLYRSFQKELDEINKLKTDKGKLNRINKYQEKLKSMYETEFEFVAEDAYNDVMQKLDYIKNGQNNA